MATWSRGDLLPATDYIAHGTTSRYLGLSAQDLLHTAKPDPLTAVLPGLRLGHPHRDRRGRPGQQRRRL
jgi:hypothetical protein